MGQLVPRFILAALCVGASLAVRAPALFAQSAAAQRSALSAEARQRVVDSLARAIEQLYPVADTGVLIARHLRARAATRTYASASDPMLFARLVTQDLQSVNEDTHLSVSVAPTQSGAAPPPPTHRVERIERLERLEGNVGYVRMSSIGGGDAALNAVETALRYLASTDAVIIDLRNSRGGSPVVANFLISHFTGPDTVHSLTVYDRARNVPSERYTLASVPGLRRPDVPLYVLVDDVTRSAAEDVPFVLQNMKRATIVGTRTAGAGRNDQGVSLGDGLVASVSFARVFNPRTRREWERTGITPDVRVAADSALPVGHALALEAIASRSNDPRRKRELALIAETLRATGGAAPPPSASQLTRFAGTYEGGQYVSVEQGRLVYQPRVAQPRIQLVRLTPTAFGAGSTRYVFVTDGGATRLRIESADGTASTYSRSSTATPARRR